MDEHNTHTTSQIVANHSVGGTVQNVLDSLFARIKSGEYALNARLPSERSLSSELGVARNTVREALDILERQNVINRRPGSGSFVTYQENGTKTEPTNRLAFETSPIDHLAVRSILEPEMVRLAVINMTPREISELEICVSKIEKIRSDVFQFVKSEEEFYRKIVEGSHNPLLVSCYDLVIEASHMSFRSALLRRYLTPNRILDHQKRYNALFNAISSRDVETAVEYIKLHLIEEQKILLQENLI